MKCLRESIVFWAFVAFLFGIFRILEQFGGLSDPVKVFYFWSGWLCFGSLVLGLLGRKWGRFLGHCALAFGLLHLSIFVYFDFYFAWDLMFEEIGEKTYIYLGIFSLLGMMVLGGFSFARRFYRPLVYLVLVCVALGLLHIVMIQKVLAVWHWLVIGGVILIGFWKVGSFVPRG
ncbi:hypothetical protein [Helicobacter pametensis]|uniref:hypothetical protein n=1 Tax=Helicobacter pametensis TaxID=95149 RepID=UPI000485D1B7|nr:hypothetical protein [Helicobacter pametensis]